MIFAILLATVLIGCGSSSPSNEGPKDSNGNPAPVSNDPAVIGNAGQTEVTPAGPNGEGLGQERPADVK